MNFSIENRLLLVSQRIICIVIAVWLTFLEMNSKIITRIKFLMCSTIFSIFITFLNVYKWIWTFFILYESRNVHTFTLIGFTPCNDNSISCFVRFTLAAIPKMSSKSIECASCFQHKNWFLYTTNEFFLEELNLDFYSCFKFIHIKVRWYNWKLIKMLQENLKINGNMLVYCSWYFNNKHTLKQTGRNSNTKTTVREGKQNIRPFTFQ